MTTEVSFELESRSNNSLMQEEEDEDEEGLVEFPDFASSSSSSVDLRRSVSLLGVGRADRNRRKWIIGTAFGTVVSIFTVVLLLIVFSGERDASGGSGDSLVSGFRLPDYVQPEHYQLQVETDMTAFTFHGTVSIDIMVTKKNVRRMVLNAVDLSINHASLMPVNQSLSETASQISIDYTHGLLVLDFRSLPRWLESHSRFLLQIDFNGTLKTSLSGFYRSSYVIDGKTEWLAVTDFEPVNARRAFPCFDEPDMKAKFTITLVYPSEYNAISNMHELSRADLPQGRTKVNFATSVPMSTYLVCYTINKFTSVQGSTADGSVKVRVWTTPDTINQAHFALESAKSVLGNYSTYYGIPFPLSKLDLIALPDYGAGAMENWGLITFRQTALLYDPLQSSTSDKQYVATVIAHELAHQWFGNLVTMKWWNDLWLNEGFASFMEYKGVNFIYPEWGMWEQFIYLDKSRAMELDALRTSHAIATDVEDPSEISQLFDSISYSKGASIIRMLEAYLDTFSAQAPHLFQNGIHDYLEAHKFGNAETKDLWQSLSQASTEVGISLDIATMMDTWTSQVGFPYLELSLVPGKNELQVTQKRFLADGDKQKDQNETLWWVPFVYQTSRGITTMKPLPKIRTETIPFDASQDGFLLANVGQAGFYRVLYPNVLYATFRSSLSQLPNSPIQAKDRAGLVDDLFAFAQAGLASPVDALEMVEFLPKEQDLTVWTIALSGLDGIASLLRYEDCYGHYQRHVLALMAPALTQVGSVPLADEAHSTKLLRSLLLDYAVSYGHEPSIRAAMELFQSLVVNGTEVPQDIRIAVYRTAVANGGEEAYEWMLRRYQEATVAAERMRSLAALAFAREPYLLQRTLRLSLSELVRSQDTVRLVARVANNPIGTELAWDFFRENYVEFYRRYEHSTFLLESLIKAVSEQFSTELKLAEVQNFFKDHFITGGSRAIEQTVETIQYRIRWIATNLKPVEQWLLHPATRINHD